MREIILSDRFDFVALVDDEDYDYLIKWRWTFKRSTRNKYNGAVYACRNTVTGSRKDGSRKSVKIMMHDVVMARKGEPRPSPLHTCHHIKSKTLDNRRGQLEWLTRSEQSKEAWKTRKNKA